MRYTSEITIDLPRKDFIAKLNDPENMKHWMEGLSHYEVTGDIPSGETGAQMKLVFSKPKMEMIETIVESGFPDYFKSKYSAPKMDNHQHHRFVETIDGKTKWKLENVFESSSLMMKIMMTVMPGMFKKQTMKYLNNFKAFAERGVSVQ